MNNQTDFAMPKSMIKSRCEIISYIGQGYNNSEIARMTGHSRSFIIKVRSGLNNGTVFDQNRKIGRPTIMTDELLQYVDSVTQQNRRMSTMSLVNIINDNAALPHVSYGSVHNARHILKYQYLPPIDPFPITEQQRQVRLQFSQHHLSVNTDWNNVIFVDESSFYLDNSHRWCWRKRGESDDALVQHQRNKYIPKIMLFGGISYRWKSPLVSVEGSINSEAYMDDCIDESGIIPEMNRIYGPKQWFLLQDGASCHTSEITMDYLLQRF